MAKCYCGHAQQTHTNGRGLCLAKTCRLCLAYNPNPATAKEAGK